MKDKVPGSVKRFKARYGRTPKIRFGKIEKSQRKLHKCPYCHKKKVKRISVGIWKCKKCDNKFTGKAYTL
ncbi:50S ribosomal protein L37ae [Candidatus Woesearchaeota archaeon]|nr:50S ribosomal protein L37ae [Candidatus Woesearchaeota archaeon]